MRAHFSGRELQAEFGHNNTSIAFYGDAREWRAIAKANPQVNAKKLNPDQIIQLLRFPAKETLDKAFVIGLLNGLMIACGPLQAGYAIFARIRKDLIPAIPASDTGAQRTFIASLPAVAA